MDIASARKKLSEKTALVVGAGGLGGYVIEHLARSGLGKIIVMDGDVFHKSNLNRQLYCTLKNIGEKKALAAKERVNLICDTECVAIEEFFTEKNADIVKDADVVIDCVDNIEARILLEKVCKNNDKILIHGAIAGLEGQIAVVKPGDDTLKTLYSEGATETPETLSFSPAIVGAFEAAEAIRWLALNETRGGLLLMDFVNREFYKIN